MCQKNFTFFTFLYVLILLMMFSQKVSKRKKEIVFSFAFPPFKVDFWRRLLSRWIHNNTLLLCRGDDRRVGWQWENRCACFDEMVFPYKRVVFGFIWSFQVKVGNFEPRLNCLIRVFKSKCIMQGYISKENWDSGDHFDMQICLKVFRLWSPKNSNQAI